MQQFQFSELIEISWNWNWSKFVEIRCCRIINFVDIYMKIKIRFQFLQDQFLPIPPIPSQELELELVHPYFHMTFLFMSVI
jgi:hypothetical protein